jgi:hypothetical protein
MGNLTDKQKAFCEQYIVDMNAAEAAVRTGYSAHTAKQQGHRLLNTPVCRAEIERLLAERQQKTDSAFSKCRICIRVHSPSVLLSEGKTTGPAPKYRPRIRSKLISKSGRACYGAGCGGHNCSSPQ